MSLHLNPTRTIPVNVAVLAKWSDPGSDIHCTLMPWKTDTHIWKSRRCFTPKLSDLTVIVNACGSLWELVTCIFVVNEMFFSARWQVGRACWSFGRLCTSSRSSNSSSGCSALRLRAGDGLPGEVMVPRAVVSLQSLTFLYKLYTASWNLNSGVSKRFRCHQSELSRSF